MAFCVKECMNKICEYFRPEKAGDRRMVIVYKFHDSGENDGVYTIRIEDGKCSIEEKEAADYTLKILTTAEMYERIVKGKMDFDLIYWTGAVLYFGDNLNFQELQTFLEIPKDSGIYIL